MFQVQPEDNHVAKEGGSGVKSENDDQKNEEKLEEDKAAEDPDSNAKNSSSGEVSFCVIIGLISYGQLH